MKHATEERKVGIGSAVLAIPIVAMVTVARFLVLPPMSGDVAPASSAVLWLLGVYSVVFQGH